MCGFLVPADALTGEGERRTPNGRAAWEWTTEERVAFRSSQALATARVSTTSNAGPAPAGRPVIDVIDGRQHPELFLPTELFESVVRHGFLDEGWRDGFAESIRAAGLPSGFWATLQALARDYIQDLRDERKLTEARRNPSTQAEAIARLAALDATLCHHRVFALRKARQVFGPALDRFMYQYVALSRTDYIDRLPTAAELHAREEGCQ
jgi:hypothetical protein